MRILVTGGLGFIGSNFINLIYNNDGADSIVCLDAMTYAADLGNINLDAICSGKVRCVTGDINNVELLEQLHGQHDFDTVVHFAAESHVDRSIVGASNFINTNINGTFALVDTFNRLWKGASQKRFLHISTDEVFGSLGPLDHPFTINSPYKPNSPYAASKASSDLICRSYYKTHGFPVIITNCSNNFGPRQHTEKFVPKIITNIQKNIYIPIYGNGLNVRDWIFVEDHCKMLWKVLRKGIYGEQYLIGGNHEMSNLDLVYKICDVMGKQAHQHTTFVDDRKGHDYRYAIDMSDTYKKLGAMEVTPFDEAIKKTVDWYCQTL